MKSLTIIIPTLNEATDIVNTIGLLHENAVTDCGKQIIVVDGGSTDRTCQLAEECGVKVISLADAPKGRGYLLNEGAKLADSDIVLFLDADSVVPHGYDGLIEIALNKPGIVAGAFEFTLDGREFGLRVVEFINRTRYRIWKRYYGDQGLFVRLTSFNKVGGFPALRLMESSDLCVKLAQQGQLTLIKKPMLTSARRFLQFGIYKVLIFDIRMWWINLTGKNVDKYAHDYWKANENTQRSSYERKKPNDISSS